MIIYHGSDTEVINPEIRISNRALDFGFGFYTTTNHNQAYSSAVKIRERNNGGQAIISSYTCELDKMRKELNILWFDTPSEEWLDYVSNNRNGLIKNDNYDCIYGPVANDTIFKTFIAYQNGTLTKEETIQRLKIRPLYNQLVFKTEKSLKYISFLTSEIAE